MPRATVFQATGPSKTCDGHRPQRPSIRQAARYGEGSAAGTKRSQPDADHSGHGSSPPTSSGVSKRRRSPPRPSSTTSVQPNPINRRAAGGHAAANRS